MVKEKRKKQLLCSICRLPIPVSFGGWAGGNNAQPINDGRCCDDCNMMHVIPARIILANRRETDEQ